MLSPRVTYRRCTVVAVVLCCAMTTLLFLPDALIVNLLVTWVATAGIGRLDSALCNRADREIYLRAARSPICVFDLPTGTYSWSRWAEKFTDWLVIRQFSTSVLDVDAILVQDDVARNGYLRQRGHSIRVVNIRSPCTSNTGEYDSVLKTICAHCPSVQVLKSMGRLGAVGKAHIATRWKGLLHLTLTLYHSRDDYSAIGKGCQALTELNIHSPNAKRRAYVQSLVRFFKVCAPTLRKVSSKVTFEEPVYHAIAARCPLLEELHVFTEKLTDVAMTALGAGCPKLRMLNLHLCECSDAGVAAIAKNGALTTFDTGHSAYITDAAICHLAAHCQRLLHVTLEHGPWFTDVALIALGQHCSQLRCCRLTNISITHIGLQSLAAGCPLLEELRIRDCPYVGPGVEALAFHCPQLRVLAVLNAEIPARAVMALAQRCTLLEKVRLNGAEVGDVEATALVTQCERLTHLDVSNTSVTGLCVRSIAVQCRALQYIAVNSDVDPFQANGVVPPGRGNRRTVWTICVAELKCAINGTSYYAIDDSCEEVFFW
jgi:hypothetical protein